MSDKPGTYEKLIGTLGHTLKATLFVLCHTAVSLIVIGCILLVERALHDNGDPKLYDWFPWRYVFDTMDLGVVATYIIRGVKAASRAFEDDDP